MVYYIMKAMNYPQAFGLQASDFIEDKPSPSV